MGIKQVRIDYYNEKHAEDLMFLMNAYASDIMGGGAELSDYTQQHLILNLQEQAGVFSVVCYIDNQAAGLVNCVKGFSTFNAKPLINIHDVIVLAKYRGQGIAQKMFTEVEAIAKELGCCKLTLEVLEGNDSAKRAYQKIGFSGYELDPKMGHAVFWQKKL